MIRLALWIIGSLIVAALAAWLMALPGTLTLELAGYRMQPRLGTAVVLLLLAAALIILVWAVLRRIFGAPRAMAGANRASKLSPML
jgi:HemY protein